MAERVASQGEDTVFCVEWEGRGYTADSWRKDRALVEAAVGPGPVWGAPADTGYFFSRSKPLSPTPPLTVTRHGQADAVPPDGGDGEDGGYGDQLAEAADLWQEWPDWASLEADLQIVGPEG